MPVTCGFLYERFIGSETYATARDYDGHGTHTASTAAGNPDVETSIFGREFGEVSGIAPDAHVVAYSACGDLGCLRRRPGGRHRPSRP